MGLYNPPNVSVEVINNSSREPSSNFLPTEIPVGSPDERTVIAEYSSHRTGLTITNIGTETVYVDVKEPVNPGDGFGYILAIKPEGYANFDIDYIGKIYAFVLGNTGVVAVRDFYTPPPG